jgi:hypothetical protein
LDSFKSELDMYKASEYAKRIGDFEQTSLQGTEASLTFEGQTSAEAENQTMYTAIPSLQGISKYQGQFAIKDGQLVYMGEDTEKIGWAEDVGVKHEVAGQLQIVLDTVEEFVVEQGTDIVYKLKINSSETIIMTSDILSKIKVLDNAEQNLATQPEIVVEELTGNTATLKQYSIIIKTNFLDYQLYKLKIESGIATNQSGVANLPFVTANSFEVVDNTPPEAPEISITPIEYTNGNVTVTIDYKDADVKLYSLDNGTTWLTYTSALTITTNNTTVSAIGRDNAENEIGPISINILNIDKVAPQDAVFNLTVINDTITGTISLLDNESEISLSNSKYIVTTSSTVLAINATEWNTATVIIANPQSISVTEGNGDYYIQVLSVDNAGNKRVNISEKMNLLLQYYAPIRSSNRNF